MAISSIILNNFRNYTEFNLYLNAGFVLIVGPNGIGKTNILEAISLISPGKGLRGANSKDLANNKSMEPWTVHFTLQDGQSLGIQSTIDFKRKLYRLNSANIRSHSELLDIIRIIWLTPKMDDVVSATPSIKRKFIDRMSFNFYPSHLASINAYDDAQKSRIKLLKDDLNDSIWLAKLEQIMAEKSIEIAINRIACLARLEAEIENLSHEFARPSLKLSGFVEENMETPKLAEVIAEKLKERRLIDKKAKRTTFGVHRTELIIINAKKGIAANLCSTGEQKAMVIAITIAHARAVRNLFDGSIIFLLDDIFSHLDTEKCQSLLAELNKLEVQCFITCIDDSHLNKGFQVINLA